MARLFERVFPRELLDRVPAFIKVGALVPVGVGVAWLMWMGLVQFPVVSNWVAHTTLEEKYQTNAQHIVTLRYHPKAESLFQPIAKGLQAVGFQVAWERKENIQDNVVEAPLAVGEEIARIAQYNSWGREYSVFKAEQPQISLATPLESGQVFRDTPPAAVSRAGKYSDIVWAKSGAALQALLPRMVQIPAGTFTMGSPESEKGRDGDEGPQHEVRIPAFEIGESEVTFAEWDRCVEAEAEACPQVDDQGWGRSDRPVINVNWNQAQVYIQWLNQQAGLPEDKGYRLPSEAEWEYAARGKTQTAYFWGDEWECGYGNGNNPETKCQDGYEEKTAPVKQFKPNGFGLYDTSGNVWEWVQDCWVDNYQGAPTDGSAREASKGKSCEFRSLRGGGWYSIPAFLRSAFRSRDLPGAAYYGTGFRLARTP
jgi:formylglycine-generating enzyme required for sulfatase activity